MLGLPACLAIAKGWCVIDCEQRIPRLNPARLTCPRVSGIVNRPSLFRVCHRVGIQVWNHHTKKWWRQENDGLVGLFGHSTPTSRWLSVLASDACSFHDIAACASTSEQPLVNINKDSAEIAVTRCAVISCFYFSPTFPTNPQRVEVSLLNRNRSSRAGRDVLLMLPNSISEQYMWVRVCRTNPKKKCGSCPLRTSGCPRVMMLDDDHFS